jgi:dihydroflavonol-4-reductase
VRICVTGATGFVGGHLVRELVEGGDEVRVTFRDPARLERLAALQPEPVKADVLDRGAMRRAVRGCDVVYHAAGYVGSHPVDTVWRVNALSPRIVVEAAAAEGVGRLVLTSSIAGIGPARPGAAGDESEPFRDGGLGLTYSNSKHEGEIEAVAAGARLGVEVVVVNPSYVFGVPVDRSQPGETSTRTVGNYLRGRLPCVVDSHSNFVDVRDVARGHVRAAERGRPGERYILGAHDMSWVDLVERVAKLSGTRYPVAVLPAEIGAPARRVQSLGVPLPVSAEGVVLMAQNWRYSSRKARRELGYRFRPLDDTLRATIEWYRELIDSGRLDDSRASALSLAAAGVQLAGKTGLLSGVRVAERLVGRRFVAGR